MLCCHMVLRNPACILWWSSPVQCCACSVEGEGQCEQARLCSLGMDGQPLDGLWQRAGAPPRLLSLSWEMGKRSWRGDYVCLPQLYHSPAQHLPSRGSPCWGNSSFFQPVPLRLRCQGGLLQRELLQAVGRPIPLKGNRWTLPTGLLPVPLHLPSPASMAAPHHPFPHLMHRSPVAPLGFGKMAKALCPYARQERSSRGQICLLALHHTLNTAMEIHNVILHSNLCK